MKKQRLTITFALFITLLLMRLCPKAGAQTIEVCGTVTSSSGPVVEALVTFIDSRNSSQQFSTLTNDLGEFSLSILTTVTQNQHVPAAFRLDQNYPNPFSATTVISYHLEGPAEAQITLYDVIGREVKSMSMGLQSGGMHQAVWDGRDHAGQRVAKGIYFCRLAAGGKTQIIKMILGAKIEPYAWPLPQFDAMRSAESGSHRQAALEAEFVVKIENISSTSPLIVPRLLENVIIHSGDCVHFTVAEYIEPNAAVVDLDSTHQHISGFGAANIVGWRPDMTASDIDKAFGTADGEIGFTILRLRIPPDANSFSANLRSAKAARNRGVTLIASPWSPPARMKTNNNVVGGRLKESAYADYAAHLKSFSDYMSKNGAPLRAVSVQNEPDVSVTYESCDWNAAEMLKFVKENAPAIGTDIIVPESFNFNRTISDAILADSAAASHVAVIAGHIYGGGLSSYPLAMHKGKEVWMTEHLELDTTWTNVLATGKEINDCMYAGMSAYLWWYIVRYYGPIHEDGHVTKRGYVMSQFARFIRPGYHRLFATQRPQSQVYITAYRGEGKVVIVAINQRAQAVEQSFIFKRGQVGGFAPYVTSQSENCARKQEVVSAHGKCTVTLAPSSVTTLVSQ